MNNPFIRKVVKPPDTKPLPGGVDGKPVDYVRWYPPDTPFHWGQGFPGPVGQLYFSQWINDPHGHAFFLNPPAVEGGRVDPYFQMFPAVSGLNYAGLQMNGGGTAQPPASLATAVTSAQRAQALADLPPASPDVAAFSFNKYDL